MAGGNIGLLAAINEEVERSHVANIALIFFAIFTLHSITYRSIPSGGIILLQISTATMMSLAYMAARNVGLNVNTLPVQAVGVGIGVDYAIYIVDRIRQEAVTSSDYRSGDPPGHPDHGPGGDVHRDDDRRWDRPLDVFDASLSGRDGSVAGRADDHQYAGRDHDRAGLLLDLSTEGRDRVAARAGEVFDFPLRRRRPRSGLAL